MKVTHIPFKNTGFFSKTMLDYLEKSEKTTLFYGEFPSIEGFKNQIDYKSNTFSSTTRTTLVSVLKKQYKKVESSIKTQQNIDDLLLDNTFTITTGHQLNLFTGPLYFLYKILSVINLSEELKTAFPTKKFVPIYWMATEDHDFEEINFFNFKDKKVQWNSSQTGGVGRFSTDGLAEVCKVFSTHLGTTKNAEFLKELFTNGYVKYTNLADATRYIANQLFKEYGLVIVDADDATLKKEFTPFVEQELLEQTSFNEVSKTILELENSYKIQVNPREINLFYISEGIRERIIFEDGVYKVNNTVISWSKNEIFALLATNPECFSPNVIMRPLYQEVILPNLCYVGGGGELAYWMQLKGYFDKVAIPFPMLLLRNSVQIVSEKQSKKLEKLNISLEEMFVNQSDLLAKKIKEVSSIDLDFSAQKEFLQQQFSDLKNIAKKTDVSFVGAVNAQEKKQLNGLDNLEKRLLRAEKRKQNELVDRITTLQNELLPNQSLEERQRNFSEFYLAYGQEFIKVLKDNLRPLQLEFTVLEL